MAGPKHDRVTLTRREKATWIRLIVAEVRRDDVGLTAQRRLVDFLDDVADMGGLCDHEDCAQERNEGLDDVQAYLWNSPRR